MGTSKQCSKATHPWGDHCGGAPLGTVAPCRMFPWCLWHVTLVESCWYGLQRPHVSPTPTTTRAPNTSRQLGENTMEKESKRHWLFFMVFSGRRIFTVYICQFKYRSVYRSPGCCSQPEIRAPGDSYFDQRWCPHGLYTRHWNWTNQHIRKRKTIQASRFSRKLQD